MRKLYLLAIFSAGCLILNAQSLQKTVNDAFLISRMVEKFHIQPRPLDDERSNIMFDELMNTLDGGKIFFTQDDIHKLSAFRLQLDDEIRNKKSTFLQLVITTYKQRLLQADTMVDNICKTPFNFSLKEKYTVAEDTTWPSGIPAMHAKMYKLLKLWVMSSLVEYTDGKLPSKKQIDSLEPSLRKKADATLKRSVKRIIQSPQGIEYIIGNMYCQALASSYDPHTAYFPPDVKENFESDLGKKPMEYGVTFSKDDDGHAQIEYLKPGSAAYQSGRLNKGDKIQSIQWDKKEPIDVSDADVSEIERTLAATGGNTVNITVKKADGTSRQVALYKERLDIDDEEDKVKSFILKGDKKIGYISLPAFYSDWEDTRGVNGCANDVAKAIIRLKKENIEGLVIDLRYNGGGSVEEAVELSGIFIDAGPLAQIKTKAPKVITLKDMVRGTIYDGPMILLVNGFSASASELVAAAMQDYNRALIVGSPTYGKATAQVVLPIDTAINIDTYDGKSNAGSYIKLTISKLYRLNGNTAQVTGVVPDIVLPDLTDASSQREANEKNAIPSSVIEPNKYYKPLSPLPVAAAQNVAKKEVAASNYFKYVQQYNDEVKEAHRKKDISLLLDDAVQKNQKPDLKSASDAAANEKALYTVVNLAGQKQQSNTDQINKEWNNDLLTDSYIKVAYQVLGAMINK